MTKATIRVSYKILSVLFLLTLIHIPESARAQLLGEGYTCSDIQILDKKKKVVKFDVAKKAIKAKITAANSIKNAKKKKAKKAALNAVIAALKSCSEGGYIIQSAVFDVEKEQCTDKKYDVNVTFSPAKSGRGVSIEVSSDNGATWSALVSGTDNGSGTTALSFNAPSASGTYLYRAHGDASPPLVAGSSGAIEAKVSKCGGDVINDALPVIRPGGVHSCLIDGNGDAWCWGNNECGNLGDGTNVDKTKAVKVTGGHKFTSLTAGVEHTCGVDGDGIAWCWGNNSGVCPFGPPGSINQSGRGALGDGTIDNRNVPTKVTGGHKFKKLAAGANHTCGIDEYNQVYCWGANHWSQVGIGTPPGKGNTADVLVPTRILGSKNYIEISAHTYNTCAMTAEKQVDCWGDDHNTSYTGNTANYSPNIDKIVTQIGSGYSRLSIGGYSRCGILPSGTVQCWLSEKDGSFGDGPTQVYTLTPVNTIGGPYTYFSEGTTHGCGVVENGDAYCWGGNFFGQLGNGKGDDISEHRANPQLVINGLKWKQVVASYSHTCGISIGGNAYCWGFNNDGQLGNGTKYQYATKAPTSVIFTP